MKDHSLAEIRAVVMGILAGAVVRDSKDSGGYYTALRSSVGEPSSPRSVFRRLLPFLSRTQFLGKATLMLIRVVLFPYALALPTF
jgi:hypothetical protein